MTETLLCWRLDYVDPETEYRAYVLYPADEENAQEALLRLFQGSPRHKGCLIEDIALWEIAHNPANDRRVG